MSTTVKTPQQLAEERKKIIQASLAQTTMEAQQSAAQQRQALAEQTRKQSINYNQALAAAQQSAYSRGNQIQQAYGQRGLTNSGMQQYGQIQNRQALGGTVNQLAGQNMDITRAAMDASRNVGQNLQNTLMRARLGADAQQMDTDEQLYAREQQGQEQQFQRALQAMEAFGISPDNPQYQQIMQQLFAGQLDPTVQAQLEGASALGDVGGEDYVQSRTGAGNIADFLSTWGVGGVGLGYMAGSAIQNLFRSKDDKLETNLSRTIAGQGKNTYFIDGQKQSLTKDELKSYVDNKYKNMEGYNSQIVFKSNNKGGKFWYNGKGYKTYNEARNAMKGN